MFDIIIKIFLVIGLILVISVLIIKRFVYFHPSSIFLPYKEYYQDVSKGLLHGWFLKGSNEYAILYCHGNAGNISHRQYEIDALHNIGYSVLIFDYSGFGQSNGIPSEEQLYRDASIFMNILIEKYDKNNIIIYGESMGAAVGAYIALKYQTPILIIDSGLPSIKKFIKSNYKILSFLSFLFKEFDTEKYLSNYNGSVLTMHSIDDDIIPYNSTSVLRSSAKHHINIKGTHNDREIPWDEVDKFIKKLI